MIKLNMHLASLDIKDAFYTIPIYEPHRKYLKFMWLNKAYQFIVMPNGYVDDMRVFNKILKPLFCWLREQGFASVVYVDDNLLAGEISFYRFIEIDKINVLKLSKGKFDAPCVLSPTVKNKIYSNILNSSRKMISAPTVECIILTDASKLGWGAHDENQTVNGGWSDPEKTLNMSCLELLAIKLAIKSFLSCKVLVRHLRIMSHNSTVIAYINKQGGTQSTTCNQLTKDIWIICMDKGTHVSAAHIPDKQNILAATASRKFHDASSEWMLKISSII